MKNNKGQIVWIALVAIVVIGGIVLFSGGDNNPSYETADTNPAQNDAEQQAEQETTDEQEVAQEEPVNTQNADAYCTPGDTYAYAGEGGSVDAVIIGLESYKGKEFCKAEATSIVETPAGDINNEVTYYFNPDASELYVITTTTSDVLPQPQTNEVHILNGQVVA